MSGVQVPPPLPRKNGKIMTTEEIQQKIIEFRNSRGWQKQHTPKDSAISLSIEAAELLEHFQWKSNEEFADYIKTHKDDVADELIDVLYWTLLMCHDLDIPIEYNFKRKMAKNVKKYPL